MQISSLYSKSSTLEVYVGKEYSMDENKVVSGAWRMNLNNWLVYDMSFI